MEWGRRLTSLFQVYGDAGRAVTLHSFYDICGDMDRSPGRAVDDPTVLLMARMRLGINTNTMRHNTSPAEVSDNKTTPASSPTGSRSHWGFQMTPSYESVSAA